MSIRISTQQISQAAIDSMLNQQVQLSHTEQQLSTGRKILTPADNPAGAAQALNLQSAIDTNTQYQSNGDAATARLNLEQSTLQSTGNLLQSVRTLALEGNNGTQTDASRSSIASQLSQSLKQLLALGNTQDANGSYIFSGSQIQTKPFTQNPNGSFSYLGDGAQRYLQIDANRQVAVNDAGSGVFMQIPNGNGSFTATPGSANTGSGIIDPGSVTSSTGYSGDTYQIQFTSTTQFNVVDTTSGTTVLSNQSFQSGSTISFAGIQTSITGAPASGDQFTIAPSQPQSVFQTVQDMITALNIPSGGNAGSQARLHNTMNQALSSLDQAMNTLINKQAGVGSRLNAITDQQQLQSNAKLQLQTTQSQVQDLNYASAISLFNQQLAGLQASQKTYLQVQGLSLFKYI
ncbi:flagellar hook-associated protein FlgL [Acidihalobacter prosperus]|uniref:Flagellar hook-associated protein 3 n=1 Tax=Acidihalobacter prosperus TaxID=160660 RepID=A0A1A6C5J7_9GAMM|nr:flagellar hook-associated protein FlgL [Acidihalobacter prosperus]OBS09837.1 flagellar hook-associated protein 3 [Acidihalobacter prosperus]